MKIIELLEKCKEKLGVSSNYALAKAFNIDRRVMNFYISGERMADVYTCLKIAEAMELEALEVILQASAESETDDKKRDYIERYIKMRGSASTMREHQRN